jgi:hypothetical protein
MSPYTFLCHFQTPETCKDIPLSSNLVCITHLFQNKNGSPPQIVESPKSLLGGINDKKTRESFFNILDWFSFCAFELLYLLESS